MTKRLKNLIQTVCIALILMLFPSTARLQEQREPVPPQAAEPQGETPAPATEPAAALPAPTPADVSAAPAPVPSMEEPHTYTIKQGDTLWDIANAFLKDPFLWPFIWKANPSITNPDLIYAGNKLVIPSLTPIERALQAEAAPKEPLIEKKAVVEQPIPPEAATKQEEISKASSSTPMQPAAGEETAKAGSRIFMPEEQIFPIVDKYAMISAGFVNSEETGDTVLGSAEEGKSLFAYDDVVYVKVHDADSVNIGDRYLIYASLHKVKHPITHRYFGKLIKGLGLLQIIDKDPAVKMLTARITLSFGEIEIGSMLTPYQEPVPIYNSSQRKAKDITGYILEVTDSRTINAQTDVVYLDKGNADGVEPGDSFLVYAETDKKGFPKKMIGDVQVFLVKEHTSTAIVKKSTEPMGKGNVVDFEK
jgi:LysM repeat protein